MSTVRTITFALSFLALCAAARAENAPSFTLPTTNGTISPDSLRGQVIYLDFWASWCDPCRKSFPWMDGLQKKYADKGLTVVAVNLDSKQESANKFLIKHPVGFTVAFDPAGSVAQLYKIKGMPSSFLIDRQGNIVAAHVGFQEKDAQSLERQVTELLAK
jgi:cytochrome c biogenesis protein CcmG, thiol:disulfide interchange protein DsbE